MKVYVCLEEIVDVENFSNKEEPYTKIDFATLSKDSVVNYFKTKIIEMLNYYSIDLNEFEDYGEYFEDEDGNRVVIKDNYISINIDKDIFNGLHTFWVDVVETED
ncbi:hypothetical protein [Clostridium sp.]|uniref:hypothetical protein n=1 Tax=Clostridium sp. TaxID=1506 RepID=UPI001B515960|nr:hypothetical protein [Clostridium sp.]MBP3916620.1 hypothetical protein [Clostridium sp.]